MKTWMIVLLFFFSIKGFAAFETHLYVAQDGSGEYTSIQEAIYATKAFPDKRITIHVKNGVYHEKICVYSWNPNLTIEGESREKTIITFDDFFDKIDLGRNSTFHTYTFKVEANDFIGRNLTIRNTAGPVGQAVALHVEGDRVQFNNCTIEGHQDTFYGAGEGHRQFFKNCLISGTTDFIFGEATVVFETCEIKSLSNSYITAASTPANQDFGFVFLNCRLTASKDVSKVYMGRPWRDYAKTVFMGCNMGKHIRPEGWHNWSSPKKEATSFYAEYGNTGDGAKSDNRVSWSIQLNDQVASQYTLKNIFINWLPE